MTMACWSMVVLLYAERTAYLPSLAMNMLAVFLGISILHRKNQSFRRVFELENRVMALESFLPICSSCKKTRDENGNWTEIEDYLQRKEAGLKLTHGVCPDCRDRLFSS
ncbi:MAG: hypothetical protein MI746_13850 [Pseudomonadales bacterium]|nr:hypothetical protein [Pseudomonadales bacterium]